MMDVRLLLPWANVLLGGALAACSAAPDTAPPPERPAIEIKTPATGAVSSSSAGLAVPAPGRKPLNTVAYPWLSAGASAVEPLDARFAPPSGYARQAVAEGSFGAWLRGLPLRPKGPVIDYRGRVILAEGDPRLAAVAELDEGTADLQQCADSILRLHAEWLWSQGMRAISYRAASGTPLSWERWVRGDRPEAEGMTLVWKPLGRAVSRDDHSAFRRYLDAVFTWANTGALARDAARPRLDDLRPGDFFVLAGSPGHAVLVLDVAANSAGEKVVLLGQGYMPAQSFHVLRPSEGEAWFRLEPARGGIETPFWPAPFPWSSLRRLD